MANFENYISTLLPNVKLDLNLSDTVSLEYKDEAFLKLERYKDLGRLTEQQEATLLHKYLEGVDIDEIGLIVLSLAMKISDPEKRGINESFLKLNAGTKDYPNLSYLIELCKGSGRQLIPNVTAPKRSFLSGRVTTTTPESDSAEKKGDGSGETEDQDPEYIKSAKFCAAFMLRLLVKTSDSVVLAWQKIGERYNNFYGKGMVKSFSTVPSKEVLDKFKESLNADPAIAPTWVLAFIKIEQECNQKANKYKMIRYLCILPLSYSSMHAFKLFIAVLLQKNCDAYWYLKQFHCPQTSKAVVEIYNILTNWFPTKSGIPKRTMLFKYARLGDSAFFQTLQSKNCLPMIYCLAYTMKNYCTIPGGADPMQIQGLTSIQANLKEYLEKLAQNIEASIPSQNSMMYSEPARLAAQIAETSEKKTTRSFLRK